MCRGPSAWTDRRILPRANSQPGPPPRYERQHRRDRGDGRSVSARPLTRTLQGPATLHCRIRTRSDRDAVLRPDDRAATNSRLGDVAPSGSVSPSRFRGNVVRVIACVAKRFRDALPSARPARGVTVQPPGSRQLRRRSMQRGLTIPHRCDLDLHPRRTHRSSRLQSG